MNPSEKDRAGFAAALLIAEGFVWAAEDTSMTGKDKEWLQAEIGKKVREVENRIGGILKPTPSGSRRVAYWLRDWGILGSVITASVALVAIAVTSIIFSVSEVRTNSEFRGRTSARLDGIELAIRSVRASQSPGPVLKELGKLGQKDFAKSLAALQKITEQSVGIVAPDSLVSKLAMQPER
jgi:hypothetical protein